jgi:eukaryotic-like serine/threonine-protein kinase
MERWQEAEYLFEAAADLQPEERARFLGDVCAQDAELLREVEDLLAADRKNGEGILAAVEREAQSLFGLEGVMGSRIGAYRIVGEIGRGGMSTVYLAVRDDDQFQKQVAIKLIRFGMDTEDVLDRFRHERQILADLEHPYIARLLDGGAAPDGRPFLVMEYLIGEPLDAYCRNRDLGLRERCRLFLKICEAVSFAHRNLVVHRDLKPGNILVGADGTPKLLDFGVAKLLAADTGSGLTATAVAIRPMTPEYTSPEQFRGETITTAADVYSLGAILYELLSGQRPHRFSSYGLREMERVICEAEPIRPSECARLSAVPWRGQLAGDLDAIVAKAMRKEPALRYASVGHLAVDLERYLEGWPVQAHQGDVSYRARKFLRRNRAAIAVGGLLAVTLLAGATAAALQARRAERERRLAEDRLEQIVALSNRSLSDVSALMERIPGAIPARTELIGSTLALLEKLAKDTGSNWPLRIALAKTYLRMGVLQGGPDAVNLRDLQGAIDSYRAGLKLLEDSPGTSPERSSVWLDLRVKLGRLLNSHGDPVASVNMLKDTLAVTSRLPASQLSGQETASDRADLLLALSHAAHGDLSQAREYATAYLNATASLLDSDRGNADLQYQFSVAHIELGFILWNLEGDPQAALGHYEESMRLREQLVRDHPGDGMYRRALMLAYEHYASVQGGALVLSMGKTEVARQYYAKALAIADTTAWDLRNPSIAGEYGTLLTRVGALDVPPSQLAQSLATLRRAAGLLASDTASDGQMLATAHEYMGRRLTAMGRYADAVAEHEVALSTAERILANHPKDLAARRHVLEANLGITRAWTLARKRGPALQSANDLIHRAEHDDFPAAAIAEAYLSLGMAYRGFAEWPAARAAAEETLRRSPDAKTQRDAKALLAESQ